MSPDNICMASINHKFFAPRLILAAIPALALLFTSAVGAADLDSLYGEWGTEMQCSRTLITPRGTRHASPFVIKRDWLQHGEVWCRLNWITEGTTTDGYYAMASALCGEDGVRSFRLSFKLSGDLLTLSWNPRLINGPLRRCLQ